MIPIHDENSRHIFEDLFYDPELEELIHKGNQIPWIDDDGDLCAFINDIMDVEQRIYKEDVESIVFTLLAEYGDFYDSMHVNNGVDATNGIHNLTGAIADRNIDEQGDDVLDEDDFDDENAYYDYLEKRFQTLHEPEKRITRECSLQLKS
jgi:hypothetical protein